MSKDVCESVWVLKLNTEEYRVTGRVQFFD